MANLEKLALIAERLVSENGRDVTLNRFDQSNEDPTKPWKGPTSPTTTPDATVTTKAVVVEPFSLVRLGINIVDDDLLKRVTEVMIIAPGNTITAELETFNEVVDGSIRYKILFVRLLRPSTNRMLYYVGVKR